MMRQTFRNQVSIDLPDLTEFTASSSTIRFCPWCGTALPESKRDRWFEELQAMGYHDPVQEDIPDEYWTDAWHKKAT